MDQRKRIEFLQQASTLVPQSISRSLLTKALDLSIESNELFCPKAERSFCSRCGTLFSPGLDTKVEIVPRRPQKLSGQKRKLQGQDRLIILDRLAQDKGKQPAKLCSYIIYDCKVCSAKTVLSGATVEDDAAFEALKNAETESTSVNEPLINTPSKQAPPADKDSSFPAMSSDKKKKKRKGNVSGLQQLMDARKKQKEEETSSSKELNLEDFLSNL
jgi:hypothetical protein